jgi:competence protein ComEA
MSTCDPRVCSPAAASKDGAPVAPATVIEPRRIGVVRGRWSVWAPIALRAAALGIALVGLAGIGAVVSQAASPTTPAVSRAGFELDALSDRALAVLGTAGGSGSAQVSASSVSAPSAATPSPSVPDPAPCPDTSGKVGRKAPARAPSLAREQRAAAEGPVVLNRADAAELGRLPGVGAKRAEAILALRQRLGRFQKLTDLLRIKGIGPRTLERMRPHLVLE